MSGEQLLVYIQNPKLYSRINLTKEKDVKILDGIMKLQKNLFHIL